MEEAATAAARAVATAWEAAVSRDVSASAGVGRQQPPPIALGLLFVTPDGGGAAGVARSVAAVRRTLALQGVLAGGQDLPMVGCSVASVGVDGASGDGAAAAMRQATVASLTLFAPGGGVAAALWAVSSTNGGVDWEWRQRDWRALLGLGPPQVPPPSRAVGGSGSPSARGEPSAVVLFQAPGAAAVGAGLFAGLDFALPGVPVAGVVAGVPADSIAGVVDDATLIYHAPPRREDSGVGGQGTDAITSDAAGDATAPLSAASRQPPPPPVTGRGDGGLRLCGIAGVALLGPVAVDARVVRGAIPVGPLLEVRAVVGPPIQPRAATMETAGAARAAGDEVYASSDDKADVNPVDGVGCRLTLVEEVGTTLRTSAAPGTLADMWIEGGVVPPALAAALSGGEVLVGVAVEGGRLAGSTSGVGPPPPRPTSRPTLIEALRSGGAGLSDAAGDDDAAPPPITLYRAGWATDDGGDGDEGWRGEGLGGTPQVGAHLVLPGGLVRVGQLLRLYVAGGDVLSPSTRVPGSSVGSGSPATEPQRSADADAVDVVDAPAISTTKDSPEGSTAREWATALSVLGLEVAGRVADGWVPVGAVAFCRDGITVSAVTAGLAARLDVDTSAVVGVNAGAGGAVGNVGGVGRGVAAAVTAVTAAAVSYFVVYARGDSPEEHFA